MATLTGKPVSELTAATSLSSSDLFAVSSNGTSKKVTAQVVNEANYNRGIPIPQNSDLDSYITPGNYYISSAAYAGTISNCPYTASNSRVVVYMCGSPSNDYLAQILIAPSDNMFYVRYRSETWSAWRRLLDTHDLPLSIANGGTGTTNANNALIALGAAYGLGTYTLTTAPAFGIITSGGVTCSIYIPLPKMWVTGEISISNFTIALRTSPGGYVGNSSTLNARSYIKDAFKAGSLLYINLSNTNGWGITNNTPVAGTVDITFTLA